VSVQVQQPEKEVKCISELHSFVKNREIMNALAEMFFMAVYDKDEKKCRNFSVLDRVATAVSRDAAKAALFDLKRGLASESEAVRGRVPDEALHVLDIAERCLDASERESLEALHFLRTVALNALSRCVRHVS